MSTLNVKKDFGVVMEGDDNLYATVGRLEYRSEAIQTIAERVSKSGIADQDVLRIWNTGLRIVVLSDDLRCVAKSAREWRIADAVRQVLQTGQILFQNR